MQIALETVVGAVADLMGSCHESHHCNGVSHLARALLEPSKLLGLRGPRAGSLQSQDIIQIIEGV